MHLVGRPPPVALPRFLRSTGPALVGFVLLALGAVALVFWTRPMHEREQVSVRAALAAERAELRAGPSDRWERVGTIERPCRVHVSERAGAWSRVWPLEGCGDRAEVSAAWVRADALTAH